MAKPKILLSFKFTGENIEETQETMRRISQSLTAAGFENLDELYAKLEGLKL